MCYRCWYVVATALALRAGSTDDIDVAGDAAAAFGAITAVVDTNADADADLTIGRASYKTL